MSLRSACLIIPMLLLIQLACQVRESDVPGAYQSEASEATSSQALESEQCDEEFSEDRKRLLLGALADPRGPYMALNITDGADTMLIAIRNLELYEHLVNTQGIHDSTYAEHVVEHIVSTEPVQTTQQFFEEMKPRRVTRGIEGISMKTPEELISTYFDEQGIIRQSTVNSQEAYNQLIAVLFCKGVYTSTSNYGGMLGIYAAPDTLTHHP